MKKILLFTFIVFSVSSFSQKLNPIKPYNENGYSLEQIKEFALASTELSSNFRRELVKIINAGLSSSGESLRINEKNILWVLEQTVDSAVYLIQFINSGRAKDSIIFYDDKNFKGIARVFRYGSCRMVIMKTICMDLIKHPPLKAVEEKKTTASIEKWKEKEKEHDNNSFGDVSEKSGNITVNNITNNYYGPENVEARTEVKEEFPQYPSPRLTSKHYKTTQWQCAYCGEVMHKNALLEHVRDEHQQTQSYRSGGYINPTFRLVVGSRGHRHSRNCRH